MDAKEFQESAKTVSNFIVEYMKKSADLNLSVESQVTPGFLENKMPLECPKDGSTFVEIMKDFENNIQNGITHRVSPHFHSDITMGNSYPSLVAEILTAGLNNVSLNWEASPAATELEVIVLNWLAKMLNFPEEFLLKSGNNGGGVIQTTCTESTLLSLLSASTRSIESIKKETQQETIPEPAIINKMVLYASILSQATAEVVSRITTIKVHYLEHDNKGKITADTLKEAFDEDKQKGLIPVMYISTMGTKAMMSYDDLTKIGPLCQSYKVWLHIDANYAGMSIICPELREMSNGIEYADSIIVGLHRLLMSQDVVGYWIKEGSLLTAALTVDPLYLRHKHVGVIHDYMNWQIATGRKFKALKIWMVMKSFGLEGMQLEVRKQVKMAEQMKEFVTKDNRFEVIACYLSLVTFRLKSNNDDNKALLERVNKNGKISLGAHEIKDKFCLLFIVNQNMKEEDVGFAWEEIIRNLLL